MAPKDVDVWVENHGSLWTFEPASTEAKRFLREHVASEVWQWLGGKLTVDHRMGPALVTGMRESGLVVKTTAVSPDVSDTPSYTIRTRMPGDTLTDTFIENTRVCQQELREIRRLALEKEDELLAQLAQTADQIAEIAIEDRRKKLNPGG